MNTTSETPTQRPGTSINPEGEGDSPAFIFLEIRNANGESYLANHFFPADNFIGGIILAEAIRVTLNEAGLQIKSLGPCGELNACNLSISVAPARVFTAMAALRGMLDRVLLADRSVIQWANEKETLGRIYHHGSALGEPEQLTIGEITERIKAGTDRLNAIMKTLAFPSPTSPLPPISAP